MPIGAPALPPWITPLSSFVWHKNIRLSHPFLRCNCNWTNSHGSKFRVLKRVCDKKASLHPCSQGANSSSQEHHPRNDCGQPFLGIITAGTITEKLITTVMLPSSRKLEKRAALTVCSGMRGICAFPLSLSPGILQKFCFSRDESIATRLTYLFDTFRYAGTVLLRTSRGERR